LSPDPVARSSSRAARSCGANLSRINPPWPKRRNDAEAALANLLQQVVRADHRTWPLAVLLINSDGWPGGADMNAAHYLVASNGDDADLKTSAKNAITSGNDHLKEARTLLAKVKK
jgi:hypothetical protein